MAQPWHGRAHGSEQKFWALAASMGGENLRMDLSAATGQKYFVV
jgi:hypothetical protein